MPKAAKMAAALCIFAFVLPGCAAVDDPIRAGWDCAELRAEFLQARADEIAWFEGKKEAFAAHPELGEITRKILWETVFKPLDLVYDEQVERALNRQRKLSALFAEKGCEPVNGDGIAS